MMGSRNRKPSIYQSLHNCVPRYKWFLSLGLESECMGTDDWVFNLFLLCFLEFL